MITLVVILFARELAANPLPPVAIPCTYASVQIARRDVHESNYVTTKGELVFENLRIPALDVDLLRIELPRFGLDMRLDREQFETSTPDLHFAAYPDPDDDSRPPILEITRTHADPPEAFECLFQEHAR